MRENADIFMIVTQNMLRAHERKYIFSEIGDYSLDLIKCLKQIK